MKNRIGAILLVLVCIGLGIGLMTIKRRADKQKATDSETIVTLSNNWSVASGKLDEQKQVTTLLEKDLENQKKEFVDLTNNFAQVSANLARTEATLEASKKEVAKLEAKISDLENQNQVLDKKSADLSTAITNLTTQIGDTQKRLAASEGDKAFLEKELKRLMAEKAELERQFNDLTVLRAQVSKLREELSIARRIEWIRQGLFANVEQKGAQRLMQGLAAPQAKAPRPNYDLNVEVSADGSVKVIPPVTNSPLATNPPAR
jgi:chromosome segregation ATPase